ESAFYKFSGITLEPKPVQDPCPIWLATNIARQARGMAVMGGSDFALKRVGRIADGWMTHSVSPDGFRKSWEIVLQSAADNGRDPAKLGNVLYHHINVNDDREAALADSKRFLDMYYGANYSRERLEAWLTYGTPKDCIAHLRQFRDSGAERITVRISTMGDATEQFRRMAQEVLPFVNQG
ncbi:MAG: LLM class flavin-dependent oxidoreductase, partial [Rhodospirillaceae bacterium]